MDVALTGGTGFVGREITRLLLAHGHRPRLIVRPGRTRRTLRVGPTGAGIDPAAAHRVEADLSKPDELAAVLRGADAVIHLVGIISETSTQTFEHVHVGLTAAILTAARAAGIRRYVHMSALGTRPGARSRYHRTKWEAEERVRGSDLAWTIFRPSLIYGPDDAFTNLFARLSAVSPALPVMGGGRNLMQPIAVAEVARAFVGALGREDAIGETYDLCGPERLTFREILEAILAATGRRRALVPVPFPIARFQAAFLETACRLLHRAPPLNRDQLLMLEEDNIGDGSRADALFGLRHEPFRDALRRQFSGR